MLISVFDMVILIGALCGLLMVIGSMILLYKGIVTLNQVSPGNAINAEFLRVVRITAQYPALGLFIIGFLFTFLSVYYAQQTVASYKPVEITGKIIVDRPPLKDVSIVISSVPLSVKPNSDGTVSGEVIPRADLLRVQVLAPRYEPPIPFERTINHEREKVLNIGDLEITWREEQISVPDEENIVDLDDERVPPLVSEGRYHGDF